MPTPQELATALGKRTRAAQAQVDLAVRAGPSGANQAGLSAAMDSLEAGMDLANTMLTSEADAGRTAGAQYRELDTAIDRAAEVLARGGVELSRIAAAGGPIPTMPGRTGSLETVAWVAGGAIVVGGLIYLLAKSKSKTTEASRAEAR